MSYSGHARSLARIRKPPVRNSFEIPKNPRQRNQPPPRADRKDKGPTAFVAVDPSPIGMDWDVEEMGCAGGRARQARLPTRGTRQHAPPTDSTSGVSQTNPALKTQRLSDPASNKSMPSAGAPWQEPVRGGHPEVHHLSLSGLDQLRALIAGDVPTPPIGRLTGLRLIEAEPGTATFQMPLSPWLCAPQGPISIGPLTIPADAAVACAIQTQLPPFTPFTTSELSLRLLAPAGPRGTVTARGTLIQVRRTIGLAEVRLSDDDGRLFAHGSSLCFLQPQAASPPRTDNTSREDVEDPQPTAEGAPPDQDPPSPDSEPDPHLRAVQGATLAAEVWEQRTGLEILRAQIAGELPSPPIHFLTGLTLQTASPDAVTFTMPAAEWLTAPPPGRVQGGAVALLAEAAFDAAIQAVLPAGTALAPVDLKVNYLRPLRADGRPAAASGRVLHAGRRIAVAASEVTDADGKPVAIATGSAMLLQGRPASLGIGER
jgi:uncharacterized protein (TIGR00369 family)